MKDYKMYTKIQQLKEKGFKQANVSKQLGIHRNTVKRYWDMTADEFQENTFTTVLNSWLNMRKQL